MTRALYAVVMCSQATRLLAACIIVCVVYLTPTVSQCTTKYCFDDNNDNDIGAMTAMVSRLQNSLEEQDKQHQDSIEQLQEKFNNSMEQQQEYVIKLENTMKEKISTLKQGMIYIFLIGNRLFYTICLQSVGRPFCLHYNGIMLEKVGGWVGG